MGETMEFLYQSTEQEVIHEFFSRRNLTTLIFCSWVSYHSVPETI